MASVIQALVSFFSAQPFWSLRSQTKGLRAAAVCCLFSVLVRCQQTSASAHWTLVVSLVFKEFYDGKCL